jgi:hypothetical protein
MKNVSPSSFIGSRMKRILDKPVACWPLAVVVAQNNNVPDMNHASEMGVIMSSSSSYNFSHLCIFCIDMYNDSVLYDHLVVVIVDRSLTAIILHEYMSEQLHISSIFDVQRCAWLSRVEDLFQTGIEDSQNQSA